MTLIDQYKRQTQWRAWDAALAKCPLQAGHQVLDLGCGVGDVSRMLAERGALVTAIDRDLDLLTAAQEAAPPGVTFLNMDLTSLSVRPASYDGLWSSFVSAYFCDFKPILRNWIESLRPNAWVALIEIDDLFGHEPMPPQLAAKLEIFARDAFLQNRYNFKAGRDLSRLLSECGFVVTEHELPDRELSFSGAAEPDVLKAWSSRFDRMGALRTFFGTDFESFKHQFLRALSEPGHRSTCRVLCTIGVRAEAAQAP